MAQAALIRGAFNNGSDAAAFRRDLINIAKTTLSSKILTQVCGCVVCGGGASRWYLSQRCACHVCMSAPDHVPRCCSCQCSLRPCIPLRV